MDYIQKFSSDGEIVILLIDKKLLRIVKSEYGTLKILTDTFSNKRIAKKFYDSFK